MNLPPIQKTQINAQSEWELPDKVPYASHIPVNPIKMHKERKKRIEKILKLKKEHPDWHEGQIADEMKVPVKYIRRDMTTAVALAAKAVPYLPAEDRKLMKETISSYSTETRALMDRVKGVVEKLENQEAYIDPKLATGYAMLIGELRQTLELGAKISGELQTGTKVNVVVFSGLIKRIIEILHEEVDSNTFIRIRDRIRLEMEGQKPLGEKGGSVSVEDADVIE